MDDRKPIARSPRSVLRDFRGVLAGTPEYTGAPEPLMDSTIVLQGAGGRD
jgi:hypothetical protein